jgi:hypothetical protein
MHVFRYSLYTVGSQSRSNMRCAAEGDFRIKTVFWIIKWVGCPPGVSSGLSSGGALQDVLQGVIQVSSREDTLSILFIYRKLSSL